MLHFCRKVNAFAVTHTIQSIQVIHNMQQQQPTNSAFTILLCGYFINYVAKQYTREQDY
jgi:hypothetical protein